MRRLKNEEGITLIEVLFALFISGITIFSMMMLFPKMKVLLDTSSHKLAALQACQSKIETIRRSGFSQLYDGTEEELVVLDNGEDLSSTNDDVSAVLLTRVTDIVSGAEVIAKKVYVKCTWNSHRTVNHEYLEVVLNRNIL